MRPIPVSPAAVAPRPSTCTRHHFIRILLRTLLAAEPASTSTKCIGGVTIAVRATGQGVHRGKTLTQRKARDGCRHGSVPGRLAGVPRCPAPTTCCLTAHRRPRRAPQTGSQVFNSKSDCPPLASRCRGRRRRPCVGVTTLDSDIRSQLRIESPQLGTLNDGLEGCAAECDTSTMWHTGVLSIARRQGDEIRARRLWHAGSHTCRPTCG